MQERRKGGESSPKGTTLPVDYLRMVKDVFTANFAEGLGILASEGAAPGFEVSGEMYTDEIMIRASLIFEGQLAATTAYASTDFDPAASSPKLEELLGSCVDALGAVFTHLLDPTQKERLEHLRSDSLAALEEIPFEWTSTEINRREIFIRVDKANPNLDRLADEWLAKNDPKLKKSIEAEEEEAEEFTQERVQQLEEEKNRRGGGSGPTFH